MAAVRDAGNEKPNNPPFLGQVAEKSRTDLLAFYPFVRRRLRFQLRHFLLKPGEFSDNCTAKARIGNLVDVGP